MKTKTLLIFLALCSTALAQVNIAELSETTWANFENPRVEDGKVIAKSTSKPIAISTSTNYQLTLGKPYKWIVVSAERIPYLDIEVDLVQVDATQNTWKFPELTATGKYRVVAEGYPEAGPPDKGRLIVDVVGPGPPPPPPPPVPSPVDNTYGVGKPAYDLAPRNVETISKYASIYEQAGEFLFGRPSLKAVYFDKPTDSANPDRSVLAWMNREINNIPCPDLAVCQQWKEWQTGIRAAFTAAQANKQFTTKEWYGAFNEVAAALRQVK